MVKSIDDIIDEALLDIIEDEFNDRFDDYAEDGEIKNRERNFDDWDNPVSENYFYGL